MMSPTHLAIAALGGAAIGLERQRTGHATGQDARFGGLRTFTLVGGLGGVAGGFVEAGWVALAAVIIGASAGLVLIAYAAKSRHDVDATTEFAALVALAAGTVAGMGSAGIASAIVAITVVLLLEKRRLHALTNRIDEVALQASARFAVLALVILPILPSGPFGPFGAVRPRELWALVLFFSALSFAAWIARRLLGPAQGVVAAGVLGGLISSTSVTLSFARASGASGSRLALALGTVAACTVMLVRVTVAAAVLNWAVARAFVPYAALGLVIGLAVIASAFGRAQRQDREDVEADVSPLQLRAALQMTALFQVVLILVAAVIAWWSVRALFLTSAFIGLTDLDALTLSLARGTSGLAPDVAARALAVGAISNTLLKLSVALVFGRGVYRPIVVLSLGLMAAAIGLSLRFF